MFYRTNTKNYWNCSRNLIDGLHQLMDHGSTMGRRPIVSSAVQTCPTFTRLNADSAATAATPINVTSSVDCCNDILACGTQVRHWQTSVRHECCCLHRQRPVLSSTWGAALADLPQRVQFKLCTIATGGWPAARDGAHSFDIFRHDLKNETFVFSVC